MSPKSIPPFPNKNEPLPGVPRKFPGQTAPSDDGLEAAKKESASSMKSGPGEDPFVESGLPEHDPERPRQTPEEQSSQ